jgi:hypothetical protein
MSVSQKGLTLLTRSYIVLLARIRPIGPTIGQWIAALRKYMDSQVPATCRTSYELVWASQERRSPTWMVLRLRTVRVDGRRLPVGQIPLQVDLVLGRSLVAVPDWKGNDPLQGPDGLSYPRFNKRAVAARTGSNGNRPNHKGWLASFYYLFCSRRRKIGCNHTAQYSGSNLLSCCSAFPSRRNVGRGRIRVISQSNNTKDIAISSFYVM